MPVCSGSTPFVLLAASVLTLTAHQAAAQTTCTTTQLTTTTETSRVGPGLSIDGGGNFIAIEAPFDLTGDNPDHNNEIFVYDQAGDSFTQITDTSGDIFSNALPSISDDGTRVAFVSNRDHTGENAEEEFELFLYDVATDSFTQVSEGGGIIFLDISSDGARVAFSAYGDLTGDNPDGNLELFLYDVAADTLTQITDTTLGFHLMGPQVNGDGTLIAFTFDHDLTGDNSDLSDEVFLYDTTAASFTQITNSSFDCGTTGIDDAGTIVSFSTDADLTGDNSENLFEVFLYDLTSETFTQVTDTVTPSFGSLARMSNDGTHLVLNSRDDLTGDNPDGSLEFFLYDIAAGTFTQVSNLANVSGAPIGFAALSADGTRVTFGAASQQGSDNADGNLEYFYVTCGPVDSDGDGLPDDQDPDTVADVVVTLPNSDFNSAGNKNAMLSRLAAIEQQLLDGKVTQALQALVDLRRKVDGCGTTADKNDWIKSCTSQLEVRELIDALIDSLS